MKTKDSDTNVRDTSKREHAQKAFDDDDFRSILNDFAKDFDVGTDSQKELEEIRKQNDLNDSDFHVTKDEKNIRHKHIDVYKEFQDADASVIYSYEESQFIKYESDLHYHIDEDSDAHFIPEELKRGISGVFDIQELIEVLRKENMLDIATISIPPKLHYTDFLVLATARSPRHCQAVAEFINKLYKKKKNETDRFVIIEGGNVDNWKVIDMGNIVLHLFLGETRALYDIESLWLFDQKYDSGGSYKPDPMLDEIEKQMAFFNSLQQTSTEMPKDVS